MVLCCVVFPSSYQICEFLYEKKQLYDRIVDCYLRDPLRKVALIPSDQASSCYLVRVHQVSPNVTIDHHDNKKC